MSRRKRMRAALACAVVLGTALRAAADAADPADTPAGLSIVWRMPGHRVERGATGDVLQRVLARRPLRRDPRFAPRARGRGAQRQAGARLQARSVVGHAVFARRVLERQCRARHHGERRGFRGRQGSGAPLVRRRVRRDHGRRVLARRAIPRVPRHARAARLAQRARWCRERRRSRARRAGEPRRRRLDRASDLLAGRRELPRDEHHADRRPTDVRRPRLEHRRLAPHAQHRRFEAHDAPRRSARPDRPTPACR